MSDSDHSQSHDCETIEYTVYLLALLNLYVMPPAGDVVGTAVPIAQDPVTRLKNQRHCGGFRFKAATLSNGALNGGILITCARQSLSSHCSVVGSSCVECLAD